MAKYTFSNEVYDTICEKIQSLKHKDCILVAIDGRCGSGKTTLANKLKQDLSCEVLAMDDFFLRPEQRTEERYQEPGGNVDYERVEEVLKEYKEHNTATYQPFDCQTFTLGKQRILSNNPVLIVEGSYSCHPRLQKYYDYKLFLTIEPQKQRDRLHNRDRNKIQDFIEKWIPLEENYFMSYNIEQSCDDVIDMSGGSL